MNLDPANENIPYTPTIDISELITLDDACAEFGLGPNGGALNSSFLHTYVNLWSNHWQIRTNVLHGVLRKEH